MCHIISILLCDVSDWAVGSQLGKFIFKDVQSIFCYSLPPCSLLDLRCEVTKI